MKHIATVLAMIGFVMPFTAAHADDFGARFTDEAPVAFGDDIQSPEDILSEILAIEPAAGDEEIDETFDEESTDQDAVEADIDEHDDHEEDHAADHDEDEHEVEESED